LEVPNARRARDNTIKLELPTARVADVTNKKLFIAKIASQADSDAQFEIEQGLTNQIAIAIQRGNATMILEALKHSQRASARPHRA
jgi:hypothetical protein